MKDIGWWNAGKFFGNQYVLGDDSLEGYIPGCPESLEQRTEREVSGVIALLKTNETSLILDCPCGYGRHSILLAKEGYCIQGVDLNEAYLREARKKAKKAKIRAKFNKADMRFLGKKFHEKFDFVINLFYSFGFFNERENIQVMQQFYNSLKQGGKLLLHTDVSPEIINSGDYKLREKRNLKSGGELIIKENYDHETKRINGTWMILDDKGKSRILTPYSVRVYSRQEFEDLAKKCGFRRVSFYGSFNGEEFSPKSRELIMITEK